MRPALPSSPVEIKHDSPLFRHVWRNPDKDALFRPYLFPFFLPAAMTASSSVAPPPHPPGRGGAPGRAARRDEQGGGPEG
ncbi:hypothetical protein, partial [Akkermansia sp.]|uniref:hypothetical protein n=1 Tax=Akkermansia sp. TaxID=1872421 RepID=UPI0025C5BE37